MSLNKDLAPSIVQKGFLWAVLLGIALVLLGWLLVPTTNLLSVGGALLVLFIYGLVGYLGFSRLGPEILGLITLFGLLAAAVFAGEILLEYAVLPGDNTAWGIIEFGLVFVLYFLSSLVMAYRSRSMRDGILAALVSAMLSSVVWLIVLLLTFYIFRGTARQEQVFMAEGDYEDFARSGLKDFSAFVMEDFFGAAFFHLLLAPLIAGILGVLGGLLGKGLAQLKGR